MYLKYVNINLELGNFLVTEIIGLMARLMLNHSAIHQHFTLDFDYDSWLSPLREPNDNMERHIEIAFNYCTIKDLIFRLIP